MKETGIDSKVYKQVLRELVVGFRDFPNAVGESVSGASEGAYVSKAVHALLTVAGAHNLRLGEIVPVGGSDIERITVLEYEPGRTEGIFLCKGSGEPWRLAIKTVDGFRIAGETDWAARRALICLALERILA